MNKSLLILLALLPSFTYACINLEGTSLEGKPLLVEGKVELLEKLHQAVKDKPESRAPVKRGYTHQDMSEQEVEAINLMYLGRSGEAAVILEELEKSKPGSYSVAANLGTAYELAGKNESALKWIKEAISRNPESHHGTEWVHVLILEAKVAAEKNGQPVQGRFLPVQDRLDKKEVIQVGDKTYPAETVLLSIAFQLKERALFVKPKDYYVAELFYSMALLQASQWTLESAIDSLKLAKEYGFSDEALINQKIAEYEAILKKSKSWFGSL